VGKILKDKNPLTTLKKTVKTSNMWNCKTLKTQGTFQN